MKSEQINSSIKQELKVKKEIDINIDRQGIWNALRLQQQICNDRNTIEKDPSKHIFTNPKDIIKFKILNVSEYPEEDMINLVVEKLINDNFTYAEWLLIESLHTHLCLMHTVDIPTYQIWLDDMADKHNKCKIILN